MLAAEIDAALDGAGYSRARLAEELGVSEASVAAAVESTARCDVVETRIARIIDKPLHHVWPDWYPIGEREALIDLLRDFPIELLSDGGEEPSPRRKSRAQEKAHFDQEMRFLLAFRKLPRVNQLAVLKLLEMLGGKRH